MQIEDRDPPAIFKSVCPLACDRQLALARIPFVKPRTTSGVKQDDKAHS